MSNDDYIEGARESYRRSLARLSLRILDASSLNIGDLPVSTPELFLAWQATQLGPRKLARAWHDRVQLYAKINHGRWLVTCSICDNDAFTHPEWRIACCAECGSAYAHVLFPTDRAEIETILLTRRLENRNWKPGESAVFLIHENVEHGLRNEARG